MNETRPWRMVEAARVLNVSRVALYHRVIRARRRGEPTPFALVDAPDQAGARLVADPADLMEWAQTWVGRHARRRPRARSKP